jgi:hypothetical protein
MKTRLLSLVVVGMAAWLSSANAFEEPDGFLGVKWGTPREETKTILHNRANQPGSQMSGVYDPSPGMNITLHFSDKLGGAEVKYMFEFDEGRFYSASIVFDPSNFDTIKTILVGRYGKPTASKASTLTNAMGAKFVNEQFDWIGKTRYVSLSKYVDLRRGIAMIGPTSELNRQLENRKREIQDAIKGM